jgi:NADH:ubiquinone oxidoreductase subunit H
MDDTFIVVKTIFFAILFVWIRATYPRIRYDHLIFLTWKYFLPIIIGLFIILFPISIMLG